MHGQAYQFFFLLVLFFACSKFVDAKIPSFRCTLPGMDVVETVYDALSPGTRQEKVRCVRVR